MIQCVRDWHQKLGPKQLEVVNRLGKDAVRNHKNIRLAGEGDVSAAEGTFAYNQGVQLQHNLQGYAQQIPGVAQASSALGAISQFGSGHGHGTRREGPGGYEPRGSNYVPPPGPPPNFPDNYGPPPGPPPSFPSHNDSYSPPSSFPSHNEGYNPSYFPPPPSPGPSFPGTYAQNSSFSPPPGNFAEGGYGMPGGGPSFPGADPYNSNPSGPQFPGAPGYPQSDQYRY